MDALIDGLTTAVLGVRRDVDELRRAEPQTAWKGTKTANFTLADLPNGGDYGYQTTSNEIQINVGGAIRAIGTSAVV
jgi:hypothetical protein